MFKFLKEALAIDQPKFIAIDQLGKVCNFQLKLFAIDQLKLQVFAIYQLKIIAIDQLGEVCN